MKITTENFNDYLKVLDELYNQECYATAYNIGFKLYDVVRVWLNNKSDKVDKVNFSWLFRLLTVSELNASINTDKYDLLAVHLDHTYYWDQHIFEKGCFTNIYISGTKGDAYVALALNWADNDMVKGKYLELAQNLYDYVIETEPIHDEEAEDINVIKMDAKVEKAFLIGQYDEVAARNYAISLFDENLTDEQKKRLKEIYDCLTQELLETSKWRVEVAINDAEDVAQEIKDDCELCLLKSISQPDDKDLIWWLFAHKVAPEDRQRIRLVENIEDAADNDFDTIPWVFTTDYTPSDLDFGKDYDELPAPGIYEIDESDPDCYHLMN